MFDIVKNRKIFYIISAVVILVGIIMMFAKGFTTDIDFVGGVECTVNVNSTVDNAKIDQVKNIVSTATGITPSSVQKTGTDGKEVIIKLSQELSMEKQTAMKDALKTTFNITDDNIANFEAVSPTVGKEMQRSAIIAVILVVLLMLVYISFRFEILSGCAAICALVHDVLVMISVYVIFSVPINTSFIAALLTILGYSINATIVLFDRVRENTKLSRKEPFDSIVNRSVWQTMARSINTTVTTLVTVLILYIIGVNSIKEFAFPIIVGVLCGCYSSVFLSGNFWVMFKKLAKHKNVTANN